MKISLITIQALKIIDAYHGQSFSYHYFAEKMWPNSPAFRRSYHTGTNGVCLGKGMWLCAGSYIAKLENAGLVTSRYERDFGYGKTVHLTKKGTEAIQ